MLDFCFEDERTVAFIDGPNLFASCREAGISIDYKKLLSLFTESAKFIRAYYYTAIPDGEEYSPIRPLADFLSYNGYSMVTKTMKTMTNHETGQTRTKGNMDIEIAVDMLQISDKVDHIVLFSGDGDFRYLVEQIQKKAVRVTVVSYKSVIADELRRQADTYIDLSTIREQISRPPQEHAPA